MKSLIRLPQVRERTGLSKSSIYSMIARKEFPPSIPLGPGSVAWDSSAIDAWIQSRIDAANGAGMQEGRATRARAARAARVAS